MRVTFLGTGTSQGIPIIGSDHPVCFSKDKRDRRLRVSVLIEWENYRYVIDCGPDFRYQMLRANVTRIDGVLITHEHADHTLGIDDLRPFCFQMGKIPMYAQERVIKELSVRFDYIFRTHNRYPGAPSIEPVPIDKSPFKLKGFEVVPVEVNHGGLKILGYRFGSVAYLTDVKTITIEEKEKLQNLDVLILSCIRHKAHHSHLNLQEALALIQELNPKKTYLTHISHLLGFHAEVEKTLPDNVFLAYDKLVLEI